MVIFPYIGLKFIGQKYLESVAPIFIGSSSSWPLIRTSRSSMTPCCLGGKVIQRPLTPKPVGVFFAAKLVWMANMGDFNGFKFILNYGLCLLPNGHFKVIQSIMANMRSWWTIVFFSAPNNPMVSYPFPQFFKKNRLSIFSVVPRLLGWSEVIRGLHLRLTNYGKQIKKQKYTLW